MTVDSVFIITRVLCCDYVCREGLVRHINSDGLRLITTFEGLQLKAYQDIKNIWTIGYGHTGTDVVDGKIITEEEAIALLRNDLLTAEFAVRDLVGVELNDNQFSACVSLCYNIGQGHFRDSSLVKTLNKGLYETAADHFLDWCKSNGQVIPGLLRRRQAERKLFLESMNG